MTISISYDTSGSVAQETISNTLRAVADHSFPVIKNRTQRRAEARKGK